MKAAKETSTWLRDAGIAGTLFVLVVALVVVWRKWWTDRNQLIGRIDDLTTRYERLLGDAHEDNKQLAKDSNKVIIANTAAMTQLTSAITNLQQTQQLFLSTMGRPPQ